MGLGPSETQRLHKLIKHGYGYRLYLDDLPSGTVDEQKTHFDRNIPLGKMAYADEAYESQNEEMSVFNHLDITVLVHETLASQATSATYASNMTTKVAGIDVPLAPK